MTESNNEHLALWGGRFTSGPSAALAKLSKSTQFDWRLADDDIAGSRAHARALGRAGLLTDDELNRMEAALDELQRNVDNGTFAPIEDDEDEATALERGLTLPATNSVASCAPVVPATIRSHASSACGCAAIPA